MRTLLLVLALTVATGCSTQRRFRIVTDPPGATVWVNGEQLAKTTPVDYPFIHYQTFELRIEKQGYKSFAGAVPIGEGQTDGYPFIDLPSELTQRERVFQRRVRLEPLPARPDAAGVEGLMDQARAFRTRAQEEAAEGRARHRPSR
jgi:hypothetical protein